jgi:pyruvate dehydrogenase E2 component (dihydrolipoamide acetyltransferase)
MPQVPIVMPKMSMTMTEGELLVWHVKVGDHINAGDVVCEVATDKIDMEVEATATGVVVSLHGEPGDVMDVGTPLIMVEAESDDLLAGIFDTPATPEVVTSDAAVAVAAPEEVAVVEVVSATSSTSPTLATPKARATAQQLEVDIESVSSTNERGIITHHDVNNFASNASPVERSLEKRLKTRLAIARAIEGSADIPAYSVTFSGSTSLPNFNSAVERTAHLALAWARTLRAFPELHVNWNEGHPATFADVRLAVSVMASHGVVTPSVLIPQHESNDFASHLRDIIQQASVGKIAVDLLQPSTSGFAEIAGAVAATGILIRPQSTALAVGEEMVDSAGHKRVSFTITADHRIADPADVALLAQRLMREL